MDKDKDKGKGKGKEVRVDLHLLIVWHKIRRWIWIRWRKASFPDCPPGEKVGFLCVPIPACPRFSADSNSASTSGISGSTGGGN